MDSLRQKIFFSFLCLSFLFASPRVWGQCGTNNRISLLGSSLAEAYTCAGDNLPNVLAFRSSALGVPYVLVVTDVQGKIFLVTNRLSIDFDQLAPGNYRVYVLSFIGGLLASPGMNVFTDRLGFICHSLSSNYISVQHFIPDGGQVSFSDGGVRRQVCGRVGNSKVLSFSSSSPSGNYRYFLTDKDNVILEVLPGNTYDFGELESPLRIWGASLTGAIASVVGQDIRAAQLSRECFDLSDNFLEIDPVAPDPSEVRLKDVGTSARFCASDMRIPAQVLENTSKGTLSYTYVVTDASDRFVRFISGSSFLPSDFSAGSYRIWGLSYQGELSGTPGQPLGSLNLSDECFLISSNYISLDIYDVNPGAISDGEAMEQRVVFCTNTAASQTISFNFPLSAQAGTGYVLLILDEQKRVIRLDTAGKSVDFSVLPGNKFFVLGLAYEGRLLLRAGDDLANASFADGCFALSSNSVAIQKKNPNGGTLQFENGDVSREFCYSPSVDPGTFKLLTTGGGGENYLFLLTDANKKILTISADGLFNLMAYPSGTYRIYGLAYTGALSFPSGAFIDQTTFSDECADLSDNFITITKTNLDGASVRLSDGRSEILDCGNSVSTLELTMSNASVLVQQYAYLLTDSQNRLIRLYRDNKVVLLPEENGDYRVWGLAYSGNLLAVAGDDVGAAVLSNGCYELSRNFVQVKRRVVDGGIVVSSSGTNAVLGCIGTRVPLEVEVRFSRAPKGDKSMFILTDISNRILSTQSNPVFLLDGFDAGVYRVWHAAYSGNFLASSGQNAATAALSDSCADLSDNFLELTLDKVDGGRVAIVGDTSTTKTICLGQGSGFISLQNSSQAGTTYRYVLTNANDQVILILIGSSIDLSVAPPGEYRIYGVSYTGRLLLGNNSKIREAVIADRCYALSSNFITIRNERVRGGVIAFSDGRTDDRYVCPDNSAGAQRITFQRGASQGPSFVYLVTNTSGLVAGISSSDAVDFSTYPAGEYRVWGLAYAGTLLAGPGFNPASGPFAQGCFSLSDNALRILKINPSGGSVATESGSDIAFTCSESTQSQLVRTSATGVTGGLGTFLLTDKSQKILEVSASGVFFLDSLEAGEYRIWSLAYNGTLLAAPGMQADKDQLSQRCFGLSTNFVKVVHGPTIASSVALRLEKPDTAGTVCVSSANQGDMVTLTARTRTEGPFVFLVTDTLNRLLFVANEPTAPSTSDSLGFLRQSTLTLGQFPGGHVNIWGLAYTGNLTAQVGEGIIGKPLSQDCNALTSDSVRFFLPKTDGGIVKAVGFDRDTIYVCSGDQVADSIFFSNTSQGAAAQYRYILTNASNLIIAELTSDVQNFEIIGFNELRIWGVSFTGAFISNRNKNISSAIFSNACFDLSTNYLTIIRDRPQGGQVSMVDNTTSIYFCPGRDMAPLSFKTSSRSRVGYVYLLTDTTNVIRRVIPASSFDPGQIPVGLYRIHGLSYAGQLMVKVGDKLGTAGLRLSSSCFELSSNFIALTRGGEVEGARLTTLFGDSLFYVCPGDGISDLVIVFPPGNTPQGSDYTMVITDDKNRIVFPEVRNSLIDFEGSAPGIYRIWGLSFTGVLLTQFNGILGDGPLSSDCYDLSENFITVVSEVPVAGTISATDGRTDLTITGGDGMSDKVAFMRSGASPNTPYRYLLTTTGNVILQVIAQDTFDFESLPVGKYRVWGLTYSGILLAAPGANAVSAPLSDNCFARSSNFINVEVVSNPQIGAAPGIQAPVHEVRSAPGFRLEAIPNPTSGAIRTLVYVQEDQPGMLQLQVISMSGQVMQSLNWDATPGVNEVPLNIESLRAGVYLLRVQSGRNYEVLRVVKVN